jgi:hypothetical protein
MTTHKIVRRGSLYRIEATTPTGKQWLLSRTYSTEEAAGVRLSRLQAMAAAGTPESDLPDYRPQHSRG